MDKVYINNDIVTNFLESKIHFNLINKGYVLYNYNIPISNLENICKKLKLHTVIPNVNAKNKPYTNVKNNLGGGSIIRMGNNITELEPTIHYIRQRGYEIVKLEELLSE